MGMCLSKWSKFWQQLTSGPMPLTIVLLGLTSTGKTTLLYKLQNNTSETLPTIGFNIETVNTFRGIYLTILDVGCGDKIRHEWKRYFLDASGILFVVDSSDIKRLHSAKVALHRYIVNCKEARDTLTPKDLASGLELCLIEDRQWFIHGMCAKTGSGIIESITLLIEAIKRSNMIRT
ncbi:ARF6 [Mytilus edulis]|uniref:ARF6 n=1 Tax=Mytilus edulis TaxID=6550 RepID=A0A8S3TNV9_MYTED|nr:ARF6 [Mytilus edulis]